MSGRGRGRALLCAPETRGEPLPCSALYRETVSVSCPLGLGVLCLAVRVTASLFLLLTRVTRWREKATSAGLALCPLPCVRAPWLRTRRPSPDSGPCHAARRPPAPRWPVGRSPSNAESGPGFSRGPRRARGSPGDLAGSTASGFRAVGLEGPRMLSSRLPGEPWRRGSRGRRRPGESPGLGEGVAGH